MDILSDISIIGLILINFFLCGRSHIDSLIYGVAVQGLLLGLVTCTVNGSEWTIALAIVAISTFLIKGFVIPSLLFRALRGVGINREIEPSVGYTASILIMIALTVVSFWMGRQLTTTELLPYPIFVSIAATTMLCGLLLTVTRKKAITQVIGYLVLENGIYLFGISLGVEQSIVVELGVLLDILVCVFIMGILIHRINSTFESINTQSLEALKE